MSAAILALDPSLSAFGYSVIVASKKPRIVEAGCIKTKANPGLHFQFSDIERIGVIVGTLDAVIKKHKIATVVFEIPIGSRSNRASVALALVEGAIVSLFQTRGLEIFPYPPHVIKEALTGDRFAEKGEVQIIVERDTVGFNSFTNSLDSDSIEAISDAAAVYLAHLAKPDPKFRLGEQRRPVRNRRRKSKARRKI